MDNVDSGRSVGYGYDPLQRVSTAKSCGSSAFPQWGLAESYDRFGNRWSQTATAGTAPQPSLQFGISGLNGSTTNQPNGYTYDASGNMTVDAVNSNTMSYDGENRMTAYNGSAGYTYDGNGLRVVKSASGTSTVSIFSGSSVIAEYDNGAAPGSPSREYVYNGAGDTAGLLAMFSGGATTYYHQDHLSVRLTTDANGNVLSQQGSFPFGEQWYQSGSTNKTVFTSYNRDAESGLDYAMARYYNSRTGAFSSADPLAGSPDDPQSWNRYPYGRNDPIDITDPSGQSWSQFLDFLDIGAYALAPFTAGATLPFAEGLSAFIGSVNDINDIMGGRAPEPISFGGSMALGTGWNGGSYGNTGDLGTNIQKALGLPTMDDINPIISDATNSAVPPDPCQYMGRALPPSAYAAAGKAATWNPVTAFLDLEQGFAIGGYLDPQPLASGSVAENAAYGNYAYGSYMAASGAPLWWALGGAEAHAAKNKLRNHKQYQDQRMAKRYPLIPAVMVANITNGFNAQKTGTLCNH